MAETFDLDDFDNPPPPPRYLFKNLSAKRVGNVLEGGTVRFTPLMNTNDTFEVRSTFEKLAGPKFIAMLSQRMDTTLSEYPPCSCCSKPYDHTYDELAP